MRAVLPAVLLGAFAFCLATESTAQSAEQLKFTNFAAATPVAPFLEFSAAQYEFQSKHASFLPAAGDTQNKPRFELVISTPVTAFPHMRPGPSNALLECIVPSSLRRTRDEQ